MQSKGPIHTREQGETVHRSDNILMNNETDNRKNREKKHDNLTIK